MYTIKYIYCRCVCTLYIHRASLKKSAFRAFSLLNIVVLCYICNSAPASFFINGGSSIKHFSLKFGLMFENVLGPIFENINCVFTH